MQDLFKDAEGNFPWPANCYQSGLSKACALNSLAIVHAEMYSSGWLQWTRSGYSMGSLQGLSLTKVSIGSHKHMTDLRSPFHLHIS